MDFHRRGVETNVWGESQLIYCMLLYLSSKGNCLGITNGGPPKLESTSNFGWSTVEPHSWITDGSQLPAVETLRVEALGVPCWHRICSGLTLTSSGDQTGKATCQNHPASSAFPPRKMIFVIASLLASCFLSFQQLSMAKFSRVGSIGSFKTVPWEPVGISENQCKIQYPCESAPRLLAPMRIPEFCTLCEQ